MHRIYLFTYAPRANRLAPIDPRLKCAALLTCTLIVFNAPFPLLHIALIPIIYCVAHVPLFRSLWAVRGILCIALLATIAIFIGALPLPTTSATIPSFIARIISYPMRILSVALYAQLFISSTSRRELIDIVLWLLHPFATARALIALMVMLTLNFAEIALREHRLIRAAISARIGGARYTFPVAFHHIRALLIRLAQYADISTYALETRRYGRHVRHHLPPLRWRQRAILALCALAVATSYFLRLSVPPA